jgi:hypothetical protein
MYAYTCAESDCDFESMTKLDGREHMFLNPGHEVWEEWAD